MTEKKIDLKPYRVALEALICPQKPMKMCTMLGNAAANLSDPELRKILKKYISELSDYRLDNIYINASFANVENVIEYIENVIDADESAWKIIALNNGWKPLV